jgi:hypothetical protein
LGQHHEILRKTILDFGHRFIAGLDMAAIALFLFKLDFYAKYTGNQWISGEVKWICSASSVIFMQNPVNFQKDPLETGG